MKDAITWFDIPTEDFNRAVKFYSDILGQKIQVDTFMGQSPVSFPWMKWKEQAAIQCLQDPETSPALMGHAFT